MPPDRRPARRPRTSHRSTSSRTSRVRRCRRAPQDPEQRRDEVDVLARREVRVERELLGHVADPLAGLPAERAAGPRPGRGPRRRSGASAPVSSRIVVVLPGAGRADDAEDRAGRERSGRSRRPRVSSPNRFVARIDDDGASPSASPAIGRASAVAGRCGLGRRRCGSIAGGLRRVASAAGLSRRRRGRPDAAAPRGCGRSSRRSARATACGGSRRLQSGVPRTARSCQSTSRPAGHAAERASGGPVRWRPLARPAIVRGRPTAAMPSPMPARMRAPSPATPACATPPTRGPASPGAARGAASRYRDAGRRRPSAIARSSPGSGRWPSRRPGPTSGSARSRTATSRRAGATPAAASSTATTRRGTQRRGDDKFDRMLAFAEALPRIRRRCDADLARPRPAAREGPGGRRPAARADADPRRQRRVRAAEPVVRADDAARPPRDGRGLGRSASGSAASRAGTTRSGCATGASPRSSGAARSCPARSCSSTSTRTARSATSPPTTSTTTSARRPAATFTAKDFRTWAGTVLAYRALRALQPGDGERAARAQRRRGDPRRRPTSSATRRPSPAAATSTRPSSRRTSTAAIGAPWSRRPRSRRAAHRSDTQRRGGRGRRRCSASGWRTTPRGRRVVRRAGAAARDGRGPRHERRHGCRRPDVRGAARSPGGRHRDPVHRPVPRDRVDRVRVVGMA